MTRKMMKYTIMFWAVWALALTGALVYSGMLRTDLEKELQDCNARCFIDCEGAASDGHWD